MGKPKQQAPQGKTSTTCYVQILGLGTDTGDTTPSVLLFFDHLRFLFNVGEGFQRFCVQHRVKLAKTSGIFVTRTSTEAAGGLPGMLITMADSGAGLRPLAGASGMSVYGPRGLSTLTTALGTFVNVRDIGLQVHEFGKPGEAGPDGALPPIMQGGVVTITPVMLEPESATAAAASVVQPLAGAAAPAGSPAPPADSDEATPCPPSYKRQRLEYGADAEGGLCDGEVVRVAPEGPAACYVCKLADVLGKFRPDKAKALGVTPGPAYGQLQRGLPVMTAAGCTVEPGEVMEPATPGPLALVVDCPSPSYLPALLRDATLRRCQEIDSRSEGQVTVVVHVTPAEVAALPEYRRWVAAFGGGARHIMANTAVNTGRTVMSSSALIQARLNVLAPEVFPLPSTSWPAAEDAAAPAVALENTEAGHNMLKYWLRPVARQGVDTSDVEPIFDALAAQDELRRSQPDIMAAVEAATARRASSAQASTSGAPDDAIPAVVRNAGREQLEVVFLGTGAAIPAKYRNVSGIFVNLFEKGGIMLDCGEGSYGQLVRRYGTEGAARVVGNLRCVWISHIHADHHAGLPRLLTVRQRVLGPDAPPLPVIGPRPLRRALQAYAALEPMSFQYIDTIHTVAGEGLGKAGDELTETLAQVNKALGLVRLESVRVVHCSHAFAVALVGEAGWKLVYSGDTRPCDQLVAAAKDATILIHEATFEDDLVGEAISKRHSTTGEAVGIGARAGAYRTILTHFSQRYAKLPVIDASFQESTCIAFDLMSANLADLPELPKLLPALQMLFRDETEQAEEE